METRQEKRAGNQTLKKKKWYQDILLCTVGIILGLLMLLQFSIYLIFRPEHPITWEDKRAVIEYCEYKYSGKAAIKESDAIQYGVDQTRFDEYTVQMDSDLFHVNVSVTDFDWSGSGHHNIHKSIMGDDRQLDKIREAMVQMLIEQMSLPEPDRVVFRVSTAYEDKYNTSIQTYYDGSNIREVYNKEGIDAIFLYKDIDLSQYQDQRGILPYNSASGDYFGRLLLCEIMDSGVMDDFGYDSDTVVDALEYTTKYNGRKWVEIVRHGPLE